MANSRRTLRDSKPSRSRRDSSILSYGQEVGLAIGQAVSQKRNCKNCGAKEVYVIESRPYMHRLLKETGRRRRLECARCKHRHSTVEVSSELFDYLVTTKVLLEKVKSALHKIDLTSFQVEPKGDFGGRCHLCIHCTDNHCSFGVPEFNTEEASDCNLFASLNSHE